MDSQKEAERGFAKVENGEGQSAFPARSRPRPRERGKGEGRRDQWRQARTRRESAPDATEQAAKMSRATHEELRPRRISPSVGSLPSGDPLHQLTTLGRIFVSLLVPVRRKLQSPANRTRPMARYDGSDGLVTNHAETASGISVEVHQRVRPAGGRLPRTPEFQARSSRECSASTACISLGYGRVLVYMCVHVAARSPARSAAGSRRVRLANATRRICILEKRQRFHPTWRGCACVHIELLIHAITCVYARSAECSMPVKSRSISYWIVRGQLRTLIRSAASQP